MRVVGALVALAAALAGAAAQLSVGIHAQAMHRDDGQVIGSEMTTLGLARALERHPRVHKVRRYAPGAYDGLDETGVDLFVIEGPFGGVEPLIHRLRFFHPRCKILFWLLTLVTMDYTLRLDVDGYLTNSPVMHHVLNHLAPTHLLPLAADRSLCQGDANDAYAHNVTYVGEYTVKKPAHLWDRILGEAIPHGLVLYGARWENQTQYAPHWRGPLPFADLPVLYESARVVLGVTQESQSAVGMVNNRVFEVLVCGACLISDAFAGIEDMFGDLVHYSREPGDTDRHLRRLLALSDEDRRRECGAARAHILERHTYDHRVEELLAMHDELARKAFAPHSLLHGRRAREHFFDCWIECSRTQGGYASMPACADQCSATARGHGRHLAVRTGARSEGSLVLYADEDPALALAGFGRQHGLGHDQLRTLYRHVFALHRQWFGDETGVVERVMWPINSSERELRTVVYVPMSELRSKDDKSPPQRAASVPLAVPIGATAEDLLEIFLIDVKLGKQSASYRAQLTDHLRKFTTPDARAKDEL